MENNFCEKGGVYYRPWVKDNYNKGFIDCIWCNKEFQTKKASRRHRHEYSDHIRKRKSIQEI